MKLVLVNSLYYPNEPGGAERGLRLLAEALSSAGLSVTVVCLSPTAQHTTDTAFGIQVIRLPLANLYWPFGSTSVPSWKKPLWHTIDDYNPVMGRRLGTVLDQIKPHLVHFHNIAGFSSAALHAASNRKLPIAQTLHDYYYVCPRTSMFRNGRNCEQVCRDCRMLTIRRRRAASAVDLVCGVSHAMLRRIQQAGAFLNTPRKDVVYNANLVVRHRTERHDLPPGHELRLGYLGRLDPAKGIEVLFEAIHLLGDVPVRLTIAGRGTDHYEAVLRAKSVGLPVRFLGHVEPADFFAGIDLLVVPSIWEEPFGRVVQEAFSFGVPVIGSSAGGIPEAMGSQDIGMIVPPGDAPRLAEAIRRYLGNGLPAERYMRRCLVRSAEFDLPNIVSKQTALYEALLDR